MSSNKIPVRLTNREREVAGMVGRGLTNADIAERLFISVHTVKRHLANIMAKLNAINRAQIADIVARSAAGDVQEARRKSAPH